MHPDDRKFPPLTRLRLLQVEGTLKRIGAHGTSAADPAWRILESVPRPRVLRLPQSFLFPASYKNRKVPNLRAE